MNFFLAVLCVNYPLVLKRFLRFSVVFPTKCQCLTFRILCSLYYYIYMQWPFALVTHLFVGLHVTFVAAIKVCFPLYGQQFSRNVRYGLDGYTSRRQSKLIVKSYKLTFKVLFDRDIM